MEKGKKICNVLKDLRQKIAQANDIEYTPTECNHQGDCAGTCPKCESELEYLTKKLHERQENGEEVSLEGLADDKDISMAYRDTSLEAENYVIPFDEKEGIELNDEPMIDILQGDVDILEFIDGDVIDTSECTMGVIISADDFPLIDIGYDENLSVEDTFLNDNDIIENSTSENTEQKE